ncbi:MAG TPA: aminotransferase class V-fold PLP-dependent enzyme [Longimicrobium sp.]|uniref:aminotransferase class V-fold PLP-dependent enzyme n=1 Tax=Longimicrobium sp. TaxID=2029185 RepID=UPI002ED92CD5
MILEPAAGAPAAQDADLRIEDDFPVLQRQIDGRRIVYMDSAATTLKPRSVIRAVTGYYERYTANIHRGKHRLAEEASDRYEEARYRVATFLRCQGNEVVFVRNTTEALNLVARGLGLERGDTVVGCLDAHHSQVLPWREAATLHTTRLGADGGVDLDHYRELLATRPRVVALTHCSNVTGVYLPLAEMTAMAREAGALVVVDAAQSLPHRRLDMARLPADFVAFSGHKMLGPSGVGVLFGRVELLERLRPALHGGGMVDWVTSESSSVRKVPHRLEAGTPAIEGAIGLGAAVDYLDDLGEEEIDRHDRALSALLLHNAEQREYLRVLGPTRGVERAALVSLTIPGVDDLGDVARALSDSYGVMGRTGHLCAQPYVDAHTPGEVLRLSAYLYNTPCDVAHAFAALDEVASRLGARA